MSRPAHTLVVGGTKGIGRTVVSMLAARGHKVSVIARSQPKEEDSPRSVAYYAADLRQIEEVRRVVDEILSAQGPLTGVVFFQRFRGEGDDWDGELATSLTGTRAVIEAVGPQWRPSVGGSIVVVASIATRFVSREQPLSYHVAKGGLLQLVRYYAVALGPKGVRVNGVSPDMVLKDRNREAYSEDKELQALHAQAFPLGRVPTAEEIGEVILFLLDEKSKSITGQDLVLDGGLSLHAHGSLFRAVFQAQRSKSPPVLHRVE